MKTDIYSKPASVVEDNGLKEIIEIIEERPYLSEKLDRAKKLFEQPEIKAAVKRAFEKIK